MREPLSYERLLEVTQKLNGNEQEYVMRFVGFHVRETRAKAAELKHTRQAYENVAVCLAEAGKEVSGLRASNKWLTQKADAAVERLQKLRDETDAVGKKRRVQMNGLREQVNRLLNHPHLLGDTDVRASLLNAANAVTEVLSPPLPLTLVGQDYQ